MWVKFFVLSNLPFDESELFRVDILGSAFCFVRVAQAVESPLFLFWISKLPGQRSGAHLGDLQEGLLYFLNFSFVII